MTILDRLVVVVVFDNIGGNRVGRAPPTANPQLPGEALRVATLQGILQCVAAKDKLFKDGRSPIQSFVFRESDSITSPNEVRNQSNNILENNPLQR